MLKKLLATTVLGASALGPFSAYAAAVGPYVTGQLGYADTHMGPKTAVLTNYEDKAAGYSLQIGSSSEDKNNNGLAGRVALGYQFNPYFATELGFLKTRTGHRLGQVQGRGEASYAARFSLDQDAFDLAAKGVLPFANHFNAYAKAGVAYVTTRVDVDVVGSRRTEHLPFNPKINVPEHLWAPEAAVGVSYDLAPNVPVDLSWTHIHPFGKKAPGNIDFISFGLGYNFG